MPTALITGITGQDGSYLAELLLGKGYNVVGIMRRNSAYTTWRIEHIWDDIQLVYGDLCDASSLNKILRAVQPDEIYNLGAQSHVAVSFDVPEYTADTVAMGTLRLLEAMRDNCPGARFYQASSSEMFGSAPSPQSELTPFEPQSPYACAKVFAYHLVNNYADAYGLHASNGILFNHESPRRGDTFVTRKVTKAAARIKAGLQDKVYLGNLDARRDWGFAGDFVEAMWLMLQQGEPDDYVIATGRSHSVRELVHVAFDHVGLDWREHVGINEKYLRPTEVDLLCGDATKAREVLGWTPKTGFEGLIRMMVESDLQEVENHVNTV